MENKQEQLELVEHSSFILFMIQYNKTEKKILKIFRSFLIFY